MTLSGLSAAELEDDDAAEVQVEPRLCHAWAAKL